MYRKGWRYRFFKGHRDVDLSDILQTQANVNAVAQTDILDMVAFGSFLSKIYRNRCTSLPTLRKQDFVIKLQGQESKNLSLVPLN